MKLKQLIILLISIILICIGAVLIIYYTQIIKHVDYMDMDVTTGSYIGFNLDPDAMHFGVLGPGRIAKRELVIENNFNKEVLIIIKIKGNISDMITISDNNFILNPGQNNTVTFACQIPQGTPDNTTYAGRIKTIFKRS